MDCIFTPQANFTLNSGVDSSLHKNSHHQIIFTNFNQHVFYLHHMNDTFGLINMQILLLSEKHSRPVI